MRLHRGNEDRAHIPSRVSAQRAYRPFLQSGEHNTVERPDRLPCLDSCGSAIGALLRGKDANLSADRGLSRSAQQRRLSRPGPIAVRTAEVTPLPSPALPRIAHCTVRFTRARDRREFVHLRGLVRPRIPGAAVSVSAAPPLAGARITTPSKVSSRIPRSTKYTYPRPAVISVGRVSPLTTTRHGREQAAAGCGSPFGAGSSVCVLADLPHAAERHTQAIITKPTRMGVDV